MSNSFRNFFGNKYYLLLAAAFSIPVWQATEAYLGTINISEEETVATGLTICFFAGIFCGRYFTLYWLDKGYKPSMRLIIALSLLLTGCVSWLFFHTDFPLHGRNAINFLLYLLPFLLSSLLLGIVVKLVRAITQGQLREARISAEQHKGELQLLQSQLSPHFLFNTLNNLYGLSLTQHEKLPPLLLRLSDLLRYSVYEAGESFVPLQNEIDYLNNYIEFEKIRMGSRLQLETDIQPPADTQVRIAPMLLIVFVENAFKHAGNTTARQVYIRIELVTEKNVIGFRIINSFEINRETSAIKSKHSGLGLANVQKRLDLLYPAEHIFYQTQENNLYTVSLQLKAK